MEPMPSTIASATPIPKPTSSESSLDQREQMVVLKQAGWSYRQIAEQLGVARRTVIRWVQAERDGGSAALAYKSRRPQQPHPQTTTLEIQTAIHDLATAHPGWRARLIRGELDRRGLRPLPSEVTIRAWLRRQGHQPPAVRHHPRLGWDGAGPTTPGTVVWQLDHKEKGGSAI